MNAEYNFLPAKKKLSTMMMERWCNVLHICKLKQNIYSDMNNESKFYLCRWSWRVLMSFCSINLNKWYSRSFAFIAQCKLNREQPASAASTRPQYDAFDCLQSTTQLVRDFHLSYQSRPKCQNKRYFRSETAPNAKKRNFRDNVVFDAKKCDFRTKIASFRTQLAQSTKLAFYS